MIQLCNLFILMTLKVLNANSVWIMLMILLYIFFLFWLFVRQRLARKCKSNDPMSFDFSLLLFCVMTRLNWFQMQFNFDLDWLSSHFALTRLFNCGLFNCNTCSGHFRFRCSTVIIWHFLVNRLHVLVTLTPRLYRHIWLRTWSAAHFGHSFSIHCFGLTCALIN